MSETKSETALQEYRKSELAQITSEQLDSFLDEIDAQTTVTPNCVHCRALALEITRLHDENRTLAAQLKAQVGEFPARTANLRRNSTEEKVEIDAEPLVCLCGAEMMPVNTDAVDESESACTMCYDWRKRNGIFYCPQGQTNVHSQGFYLCEKDATRLKAPKLSDNEIYLKAKEWITDADNSRLAIELLEKYAQSFNINHKPDMENPQAVSTEIGTLLQWAAGIGRTEVVRYLLNHPKIATGDHLENALFQAIKTQHFNAAQLIVFRKMGVKTQKNAQRCIDDRNKLEGISQSLLFTLKQTFSNNMEMYNTWMETLEMVVLQCIEYKQPLSEDLLMLVVRYRQLDCDQNITDMRVWKAIRTQLNSVLNIDTVSKNPINWAWFKQNLLQSTLWLEVSETKVMAKKNVALKTLYDELSTVATTEMAKQMRSLGDIMTQLTSKQAQSWEKITQIPNESSALRQDEILGGVLPGITKEVLQMEAIRSQSTEFDAVKLYDHQIYLSQLLLRAQKLQHVFHASLHSFVSQFEGVVLQIAPVKGLQRCREKSEMDYVDQSFPTTAHILDVIRASLTYSDLDSYIRGIHAFRDLVNSGKDNHLTDIVRIKNGFYQMPKAPSQYTDVKMNVVCSENGKSLIGEVQFLLEPILSAKKCIHELYEIQRIAPLLPAVRDLNNIYGPVTQQMNVALSKRNGAKEIAKVIVTSPIAVNNAVSDSIASKSDLILKILRSNQYTAKYLLFHQSDTLSEEHANNLLNIIHDRRKRTLVLTALEYDYIEFMEFLVETSQFSGLIQWNIKDVENRNVLHCVQSGTMLDLIRKFVDDKLGSELMQQKTKKYGSPLLVQVSHDNVDVVSKMIELWPDAVDWSIHLQGRNIFHQLKSEAMLDVVTKSIPPDTIPKLLSQTRALYNTTPMMEQILAGNSPVVMKMVSTWSTHINWAIQDSEKRNILHLISDVSILNTIIEAQSIRSDIVSILINQTDKRGETPLMHQTNECRVAIVTVMIEQWAKLIDFGVQESWADETHVLEWINANK